MLQETVLFLNGRVELDFCEDYIATNYADLDIICADGSFSKIKKSKQLYLKLKKVVGDFDSTTYLDDELFKFDNNQATTDFEKCLDYLIRQGSKKVFVFGASGREMDHFISNASIALRYYSKISVEFIDKYSRYFFIPPSFSIANVKGKMFSILPFGYAENVAFSGLKYPFTEHNMALGANLGVRNYATDGVVKISYTSGNLLLFISHNNYKGKKE